MRSLSSRRLHFPPSCCPFPSPVDSSGFNPILPSLVLSAPVDFLFHFYTEVLCLCSSLSPSSFSIHLFMPPSVSFKISCRRSKSYSSAHYICHTAWKSVVSS